MFTPAASPRTTPRNIVLAACVAGCLLAAGSTTGQGPTGWMAVENPRVAIAINEFMASNGETISDPQGEFDDWVELHNLSRLPVDVGGMYLSDKEDRPLRWRIPDCCPGETTIPPFGFLLLWLDGDEVDGVLHAPFSLSAGGEAVVLTDRDGVTTIDQVVFGPQLRDISYGRFPDGTGAYWFHSQPTPGAPNAVAGRFATPPAFSRAGGTFIDSFELAIEGGGGGFTLRYTLDGTAPVATSPVYPGPLSIDRSVLVSAGLFAGDGTAGPVATASYVRISPSLGDFESDVGIVVIDSRGYDFRGDDNPTVSYPRQLVNAVFIGEVEDGRTSILGAADYAGRVGMNVRGASSKMWPKKQYRFETWDELDQDVNVPLLGMPSESDWILFAPYFDRSLMRNHLVYSLWERLGYWSPRMRWVEVYLAMDGDPVVGPEDFVGLYQVMENIKRDNARLDITRLEPSDDEEPEITGGYAVQATNIQPDFILASGPFIKHVEPDRDEIPAVQAAWIEGYLNDFESVLFGPGFGHPLTGFRAWTHVGSHVDYDIMRELTRNIDGASTFMSKDRGEPFAMGPLWDYDQSFGNTSLFDGWMTTGFNWGYTNPDFGNWLKWWPRMDDDPDYQQEFIDRWFELRGGLLATGRLLDEIDAIALDLDEAQRRNYERWPILGTEVWKDREAPNWPERTTYEAEIDWLKDWTRSRLGWIDGQFTAPPVISAAPVGDGTATITITQGGIIPGQVFHTLDGTDPRLSAPATVWTPLAEGAPKRILVPGGDLGTGWRTDPGYDDSAWTSGTGMVGYEADTGFEDLLGIDVFDDMYGNNETLYARSVFAVETDAAADTGALALQVRYDDGFVAWLNGVEVARANAPANPVWNSGATDGVQDVDAVKLATFDIPAGLLAGGVNLLAVQGLNFRAASSDFLLSYRLAGWNPDSGEPARTAITYSGPVAVPSGTRVTARVRVGSDWSAPVSVVAP